MRFIGKFVFRLLATCLSFLDILFFETRLNDARRFSSACFYSLDVGKTGFSSLAKFYQTVASAFLRGAEMPQRIRSFCVLSRTQYVTSVSIYYINKITYSIAYLTLSVKLSPTSVSIWTRPSVDRRFLEDRKTSCRERV